MEATGSPAHKTEPTTDEVQQTGTRHNFIVLILYNVAIRTGWIFKTESVVLPAILDAIGGGGWLRGCLPMLSKLGQSVTPVLASDRLRRASRQKFVVATSSGLMGLFFMSLAATWIWLNGQTPKWLPLFFLLVYGLFWICVGLHNLSVSLLHGKLVAVQSRGRLMLVAMILGAATSVACAWFLMRPWLADGNTQFTWLFASTGTAFLLAGVLGLMLKEDRDHSTSNVRSTRQTIASAFNLVRTDGNFRLLALIAASFGMSNTLFPHYQAYARQYMEFGMEALVPWVIAQNIGTAVFGIPVGIIADRFGNRLAIRWAMLLLCLTPILTMITNFIPADYQQVGCCVVFFLLGLTPVTMRIFSNYTLEIAQRARQPIYLSTLGFCMALPVILMSTAVGALVDLISFESMFIMVVSIVFVGWTLTFKLQEPRIHNLQHQIANRQTIGLE